MNILRDFLARAATFDDRLAIVEANGRSIRFAEVAARSAAIARAWRRRGVGAGSRVVIAMPLGVDLYLGLAALWRLGAVAVFPEPALGLAGLRHAVRATRPQAFLTGGWYGLLRWLPEMRDVPLVLHARGDARATDAGDEFLHDAHADTPALISFTSGSTGAPKAIMRSHGFLAAQNAAVADLLRPTRAHEVDLVAFPVFVIVNLALGVTSVLPNWRLSNHRGARAADILAHLRRHGVTRALVPPSICEILALHDAPTPLDAIFTGGGPVYPDLMRRLRDANPSLRIVAVYGSTEAEPIAHLDIADIAADDWEAMARGAGLLAGHPVPQTRVVIVDDEIVVAGDHVNKGYLDPAQDSSTKLRIDGDIWHRTGDAGRFDAAGRLWLLGRRDGKAAGFHPFALECAARDWPGVRRAALIERAGRALLAIEGDAAQADAWRARASAIGPIEVQAVSAIPLDRRHASKVDYVALRKQIGA